MNREPGQHPWSVSVIAWGRPSHPRTFSGYSRHLVQAMRTHGVLRREFSARLLSPRDALAGALRLHLSRGRPRLEVSRAWMWSERGSRRLGHRLARAMDRIGERGPLLQIGTLAEVEPRFGRHYVLTDMTIPQAERAGMFAVGRLSPAQVREAVGIQRRILRNAAHVFTLTRWAARSVIEDLGIDPQKVTAVYGGPNLVIPPGLAERKRPREVLFVGIDWARKGGPLLLEAFRIVRRVLPDTTLRIVGCTGMTIDQPGVYVEGFLDKADPRQYERLARCYLSASCFCLPSLFDPFPNAIIEAASVGLATVAIDNGSRSEAVIDGKTGILARDPTPDSIAAALIEVLSDERRCRQLGEAARQHACQQFTWNATVGRIGRIVMADESCKQLAAAPTPAIA